MSTHGHHETLQSLPDDPYPYAPDASGSAFAHADGQPDGQSDEIPALAAASRQQPGRPTANENAIGACLVVAKSPSAREVNHAPTTECVYEDRRSKGGIRPGAVERINQRMDRIEHMFMDQGVLFQQMMKALLPGASHSSWGNPDAGGDDPFASYTDSLKRSIFDAAASQGGEPAGPEATSHDASASAGAKRRRVDDAFTSCNGFNLPPGASKASADLCVALPPPPELDLIVGKYFEYVSPWVPVIHMKTFVQSMKDPDRSPDKTNLLRAIVAATPVRLYADSGTYTGKEVEQRHRRAWQCRDDVLATALKLHSKESTQALIIIAFDSIKRGLSPSPWPLVAMISRKVVDMQLGFEAAEAKEQSMAGALSNKVALEAATSWIEAEERRRIFWTAFLLDRFCAIASGSAATIPGHSIRLRLPCDGYMWQQDVAVETNYFQPSKGQMDSSDEAEAGAGAAAEAGSCDPETGSLASNERSDGIGGLALTVEASESLYLITQFHNHKRIAALAPHKVPRWLSEFRYFDIRLLQWELCLTNRWRDVRVVNGYVDQNLTVAHLTHNAAIIALHQPLAYPTANSQPWLSGLVTAASTQACIMAATKISRIATRFLNSGDGIPTHQFVYSLYVAGQLFTNRFRSQPSLPEAARSIDSIISTLNECAMRLDGSSVESSAGNPAAVFVNAIKEQYEACSKDPNAAFQDAGSTHDASQKWEANPALDMMGHFSQMPTMLRHGFSPEDFTALDWPCPGSASMNMSFGNGNNVNTW